MVKYTFQLVGHNKLGVPSVNICLHLSNKMKECIATFSYFLMDADVEFAAAE